jgi:hypothetical protein
LAARVGVIDRSIDRRAVEPWAWRDVIAKKTATISDGGSSSTKQAEQEFCTSPGISGAKLNNLVLPD